MVTQGRTVAAEFRMPDEMWFRIEGLLPKIYKVAKGWTPTFGLAPGPGRHLLHVADRLPVEGVATRVWLGKFGTPLFSTVSGTEYTPRIVDGCS